MSELKVYRNDVIDWVVATSPEDATKAMEEHWGDTYENVTGGDDPMEWTLLPDHEVLSINDDESGKVEKTCAEWVASHGRGFLCSTEY